MKTPLLDISQESKLHKKDKREKGSKGWNSFKTTLMPTQKPQHEPNPKPNLGSGQGHHHSSRPQGVRRPSMSSKRSLATENDLPPSNEDPLERARKERRDLENGLSKISVNDIDNKELPPGPPPQDNFSGSVVTSRQIPNGAPSPRPVIDNTSSLPASLQPGKSPGLSAPNYYVTFASGTENVGSSRIQEEWQACGTNELQSQHEVRIPEPTKHQQVQRNHDYKDLGVGNNMSKQQIGHSIEPAPGFGQHAPVTRKVDPWLKAIQKTHEQSLIARDSEISRLQMQLSNVQVACDAANSKVTQLNQQNDTLQGDISNWRTRFHGVNNELLQLKHDLKSAIDDDWFIKEWRDLHSKIENFSRTYFVGRPTRIFGAIMNRSKGTVAAARTETLYDHALKQLARKHADYTGSETQRPLIIQALLWWILANEIFDHMNCSNGGLFWAGQTREQLGELESELRTEHIIDWSQLSPKDAKDVEYESGIFHKWRAMTAMLLLSKRSTDERVASISLIVDDIVMNVMRTLSALVKVMGDKERAAADENMRDNLRAMLKKAIHLDSEIYQHRAWIFCGQGNFNNGHPHQQHGFRFDPDFMEVTGGQDHVNDRRTQSSDPFVELIVQPALCREGNEYGEEYSTRRVLCQAKVIVCENPMSSRR